MLAPDYVSHSRLVAGQPPGREGEKWAISQLNTALSNRSIHFEDQIAAGHKVASRFVVHVTPDRGELTILEPNSGRLVYANAGHDLLYLRSQGGDCEQLRARGMPLDSCQVCPTRRTSLCSMLARQHYSTATAS
jgi:hypothetical protein